MEAVTKVSKVLDGLWEVDLWDAPAVQVVFLVIFNVMLVLGSISLVASLPGNPNKGAFWPVFIPEHYSERVSSHPLDPYSINHINHGVAGFLLAWALGQNMFHALLFTLITAAAWELFENSDFVIDRFQQFGANKGYEGDSTINLSFDMLSCGLGFAGALVAGRALGPWAPLGWILASEASMAAIWRDNMLLQTIQLNAFSPRLSDWQLGAVPAEYKTPSRLMRSLVPLGPLAAAPINHLFRSRLTRIGHSNLDHSLGMRGSPPDS
jgi:hypothetical protein